MSRYTGWDEIRHHYEDNDLDDLRASYDAPADLDIGEYVPCDQCGMRFYSTDVGMLDEHVWYDHPERRRVTR